MSFSATYVTWRYHHDSWPEPWTSDDIPLNEPGPQVLARKCAIFLTIKSSPSAGRYRTTYTEEPNKHWDAVAELLKKNVFSNFDWQLEHGKCLEGMPQRLVREGYKPLVFDDKTQFDGATHDQIRRHFKRFVDREQTSMRQVNDLISSLSDFRIAG
ncbi:hypothetical protein BDW69DRAFT_179935 [Aspergillus filifer]